MDILLALIEMGLAVKMVVFFVEFLHFFKLLGRFDVFFADNERNIPAAGAAFFAFSRKFVF